MVEGGNVFYTCGSNPLSTRLDINVSLVIQSCCSRLPNMGFMGNRSTFFGLGTVCEALQAQSGKHQRTRSLGRWPVLE